jgi:N-acetylmuramoyl-L-alanine amidase
LIFTRAHAVVLLATLAGAAAVLATHIPIHAQTQTTPVVDPIPATAAPASQIPQPPVRPTPPQPSRAVIFLDPAHGGPEIGASLGNNVAEKDVTLAFAQRLRAALASTGFAVITTRDSDLPAPLSTDQRAETANRAHALACIVIHATASGNGVHLFTSPLAPAPAQDTNSLTPSQSDATTPFTPIPWESAQAGFVDRSRSLLDLLKATLIKSGMPVLTGAAPLRPLDNLMCPAVAIEIAPNSASISAADTNYQQQIVVALANALQLWRDQNAAPPGGAQ